jgi:hypothetical protein
LFGGFRPRLTKEFHPSFLSFLGFCRSNYFSIL